MIEGVPDFITDQEIRQRAQANAELQARQQIEREHQAAIARARQNDAERLAQRQALEAQAAQQLAGLKGDYDRRAQLVREMSAAVTAFTQCETDLRERLAAIERGLYRPGLDQGQFTQRLATLRRQAGLPDRHDAIDADRLTKTVLCALVAGIIQPGSIQAGSVTITFD